MRLFFIAICLTLSGCAAQLVSESPRTVVIQAGQRQAAEAQELADAACARHQRHARLSTKMASRQWVFDCVS